MDHEDDPAEQERRRKERERRRKRRRDDEPDAVDAASEAAGGCLRLPGCGRGRGEHSDMDGGCGSGGGGGRGGGCDGCDGPCNFPLLRLSAVLAVAAFLVPERPAGRRLVRALVRGYQRRLSRFTPVCPSTPSCSAYALTAVEELGVRDGLTAAAARIRDCGTG